MGEYSKFCWDLVGVSFVKFYKCIVMTGLLYFNMNCLI